MKGSLEILHDEFPEGHDKREFLEILKKEIDRLNGVLNEFLQFARPPRPERQPCDVSEVLESIRVLCSNEASRAGVSIAVSSAEGVPEIRADAGQLQQALLNVVLNGIQAMPSGGHLAVSLAHQNGELEVRVTDAGGGVPEGDRGRVFDPFFTTKDRGTGLGLPIAHQLVQGHGGDIRIENAEPRGASFVVTLPLHGDN